MSISWVDCRQKFGKVAPMKTKLISGQKPKFYFFRREKDPSLPKFILPGVWWETRRQGLEITMWRITIGLWTFRWHYYFGRVTPPPAGPINSPQFKLDGFLQWMNSNNWSQSKVTRSEFDSWLLQSEWKTVVRWGGCQYHYTRILLAREFLNATENKSVNNIGLDDLDLKITVDDPPQI